MSYSENLAKQVFDQYLHGFKYFDNYRPSWLGGLELDRFYPDLGVGIEFQGGQHFRPVPGMHQKEEDFQRQVANDSQKRAIMFKYGYQLFAIEMIDLDEFKLKGLINRVVSEGKKYAAGKGRVDLVKRLETVRADYPIRENLKKEINRLSYQKNKDYFKGGQPSYKKAPWWLNLLRLIFLPPKSKRR